MSWGERAGVRRNWTDAEREQLRRAWTEEMTLVLDAPLEFLSVPETLELRYRFLERVQDGGDREEGWDREDRDELETVLLGLAAAHHDRPVVLLSSADRVIGALRTTVGEVLTHWEQVWEVTEEDLAVLSEDGAHGLCLEENWYSLADEEGRQDRYDLTLWGDFAE